MHCMIPSIRYSVKGKTIEAVKIPVVGRDCRGQGMNMQSTEYFYY